MTPATPMWQFCDVLGHDGKWRNLAKRRLADIRTAGAIAGMLNGRRLDAVIHLGAIRKPQLPTPIL